MSLAFLLKELMKWVLNLLAAISSHTARCQHPGWVEEELKAQEDEQDVVNFAAICTVQSSVA